MRKLTHEEFCERVRSWHGNKIAVVSEYKGSSEFVDIRCANCGFIRKMKYPNIKKMKICTNCQKQKIHNAKTHKDFEKEVSSVKGYVLLSEYKNSKSKVLIKHIECGYEFEMMPTKFSFGQRCPRCMRPNHKRTHEDFKKEIIEIIENEYSILSKIKRIDLKFTIRHNICGYEYGVTAHKFINGGRRCPKCANNIRLTTKHFIKYVANETNNEYDVLGQYVNANTLIKMKHNECGLIWDTKPSYFKSGNRCPKCSSSKGEKAVERFLRRRRLSYIHQYKIPECKIIHPLPFDFAVFKEEKVAALIEYQGEQHYKARPFFGGEKAFRKQQVRDSTKREFCKKNNIPLIEIPYTIKNIDNYIDKKLSAYL